MDGEEVCMPRSSRDEEFSAFVQARRTGLVRSACLLTAGDTHLAEDLVQTALARLYVAWPRVRRAGTESAYVWRIIVNAHIDEVRRPSRRRERHVPELPPGMRAAVVLRHWLDLSVGETAELLNCSEGTVKSQTAKAAARLRDLLSPAAVERTYP
jgi:DNA-directed RNA polymerase specialized sigma24 family protein